MATLLIDADILVYRIGWACEDEDSEAAVSRTVHSFICDCLAFCLDADDYEVFISGSSEKNFRHQFAVTAPYKGNRKDNRKPKWYDFIRNLLMNEWNADVSEGEEADDTIGIRFTEINENGEEAVICSIDKDFDQFAGKHHNPVTKKSYELSPEQARLNFYCQFLEGDRIDNIIGVKGIGKVTARKLLDDKDEVEMFETVVRELGSRERAVENGILLYLRHYPNEIWSPPDE